MLDKTRKKCLSFLWIGKREKEGIPLVKWKKMAKPKVQGGWDLKNIFLFGQALATKSLWRLFKIEGLWGRVMIEKYIALETIEDLIRR